MLGYVVPWTAVLGREERPVVAAANGTWFIWVVASQSVAIAAASIEPVFPAGGACTAGSHVVVGGSLPLGAAGLIVSLRLMLYPFGPEDLTPPGAGHHRTSVLAPAHLDARRP